MASPEWYFSTLAQSMAAIAGFIITILVVVHQLEQGNRSRRTDELRKLLTDIQSKYDNILYYLMAAIEQPYDGDISMDIDNIDDSEIVDWDIGKVSASGTPIGTKTWIYTYQISKILESVSPSENKEEHLLISKNEIELILERLEFLTESIIGGDETLQGEIDSRKGESIKPTSDIFDPDLINYPSLDNWFITHFDEYDEQYDLDGTSLLAIDNLYDELQDDMENVSALSENTHIEEGATILNYSKPIVILLVSGVLLPILSLLSYPIITLDEECMLLYESALIVTASISAFYIGHQVWQEFG